MGTRSYLDVYFFEDAVTTRQVGRRLLTRSPIQPESEGGR